MEQHVFHILNRGVEKRKVFLVKKDYLRFVHNLYDFNNQNNVLFSYNRRRMSELRPPTIEQTRNELVDVFCWSLLPNHHHILSQEKIEGGASVFSQKLTGGYTMHFNLCHQRSGCLFQGKSKIILVSSDAHFLHLPFYILSNPLDLFQFDWRERGIKNPKKAFEFLENYQWSALPDLIGKENFPEVLNKNLFYELFNTNEKQFKKDFIEWFKDYDGEFNFNGLE